MSRINAVELVNDAYRIRSSGDFESAFTALELLIDSDVAPPTALLLAAECLRMRGAHADFPRIESLLRRAISLAPDYVDAKLELGHFLSTCRDGKAAEIRALLTEAYRLIRILEHSAILLDAQSLFD